MQKGLVTVVIPNYNYAHYLREAIDSVLAQTYEDIEIIVVDDGSSDDSREVLASFGDRLSTIYQRNQGVSAARNNGAEAGRGEFIAFLDADDIWLPEKVEKQVELFRNDPSLGLVHVGVDEIDAGGNLQLRRLEGIEGLVASDLLMLKRETILGGGSGLMVPRGVFEEVGGFDTGLSTSADWDLGFRISSKNAVGFVPEILLKYRVHDSNMHGNVGVMERDMTRAFDKAFSDGNREHYDEAHGNLYKNLAGSYFHAGDYGAFVRTAVLCVRYQPANIMYFLGKLGGRK